ncbi:MAG TPA: N-6 DNA methylase, partial [Acetobacteraceae bacterium]|nr:N-6 DNA methylase [Acetobacteraceae bacterium]
MDTLWRRTDLPEIGRALAGRPGHERLRTLIADILRHAFGAAYLELDHEVRMDEVRGRADTLFGATVFEFKRDLRREMADVSARLPDYLRDRERQTRRRYLGIATDGASFVAFELRDDLMVEIGRHETNAEQPEALLAWLEPALSNRDDLLPEPLIIQRELGRESLTFARARGVLESLWGTLSAHPEVRLKRQLWDRLLRMVYGTEVGDDSLFLQHSYLTIVAKTIAARVLDLRTDDAGDILSGRSLTDAGIHGAVESDFFDWVLQQEEGKELVLRLARQAARFRLQNVQADVLKALYETLIDPAQRHDLGEYYTPDWLAAKLVRRAVADPLRQRVLDPACGSGTFLFHTIRLVLEATRRAEWDDARMLEACAERVRGVDVHPVAVIIARVTWLLALGDLVHRRAGDLHVPVFLGDSLQWNVRPLGGERYVEVAVPDERPLRVPAGFAEDQAKYEPGLRALSDGLDDDASPGRIRQALLRIAGVTAQDADAMVETFARLAALYRSGRNHIWPYVLRNLVRPLWLSRPDQRADVVLGNPPWIAYRYLSAEMKTNLRDACIPLGLWVGGVLATQQDIAALFWARCAERYLTSGGVIAFVLPYAALNRPAFGGLRRGDFHTFHVQIVEAWSFDEAVQPLFPVPASVLIGKREAGVGLPGSVQRYTGSLPQRDATEAEADRELRHGLAAWPPIPTREGVSPYRARFRNGATIFPRRFFFIECEVAGRLGHNPMAPRVRGKAGRLDKRPWVAVAPPSGPVEAEFLRPVLLGESIAPFRLLAPSTCVVPVHDGVVLDSGGAADAGFRHLAAWLRNVEGKWSAHAAKRADGQLRMTLRQRLDYMRGLSLQLPVRATRVVYAASGLLPAAVVISERTMLVEHKAYWTAVRSLAEGHYLCAVINSETSRVRLEAKQSKGQGGARDFDNLIWELPIPEYDRRIALHRALAAAAVVAERVAAGATISQGTYFTRQRRAIRDALAADG